MILHDFLMKVKASMCGDSGFSVGRNALAALILGTAPASIFAQGASTVTENLADLSIEIYNNSINQSVKLTYNPETGNYEAGFYLFAGSHANLRSDGTDLYMSGSNESAPSVWAPMGVANCWSQHLWFSSAYGPMKITASQRQVESTDWSTGQAVTSLHNVYDATFAKEEGNVDYSQFPQARFVVETADGTQVSETWMGRVELAYYLKSVELQEGWNCYVELSTGKYVYPEGGKLQGTANCAINYSILDSKQKFTVAETGTYDINFFMETKAHNVGFKWLVYEDHPAFTDPQITIDINGERTENLEFFFQRRRCEKLVYLQAGEKVVFRAGKAAQELDGAFQAGADGFYRAVVTVAKDNVSSYVATLTPASLPETLYFVKGDVNSFTNELNASDLSSVEYSRLVSSDTVHGLYTSLGEITLSPGDKFFITEDLTRPQSEVLHYGCAYTDNSVFDRFVSGKRIYVSASDDVTTGGSTPDAASWSVTEESLPDGLTTSAVMTLDLTTVSDRVLRWGPAADFRGQDYYLHFVETHNRPADYEERQEDYRFVYHPETNLYTLAVSDIYGPLYIGPKSGLKSSTGENTNKSIYTGILVTESGNEHEHSGIYNIGKPYDLFHQFGVDGDDITSISNISRANYFILTDPAYADGVFVVEKDASGNDIEEDTNNLWQYYRYRDITFVFDPMQSRLWVESPLKNPGEAGIAPQSDLSIVFVAQDSEGELSLVARHPMQPTTRYGYYTSGEYIDIPTSGHINAMMAPNNRDNAVAEEFEVIYYFFAEGDYDQLDDISRKSVHYHAGINGEAGGMNLDVNSYVSGVYFKNAGLADHVEMTDRHLTPLGLPGHDDSRVSEFFAVETSSDRVFVEFDRSTAKPWSRLTREDDDLYLVFYNPENNADLNRNIDTVVKLDKLSDYNYSVQISGFKPTDGNNLSHFFLSTKWADNETLRYNITHSVDGWAQSASEREFTFENEQHPMDVSGTAENFLTVKGSQSAPQRIRQNYVSDVSNVETGITDFITGIFNVPAVIDVTLKGGTDPEGNVVETDVVKVTFDLSIFTGVDNLQEGLVDPTDRIEAIYDAHGMQVATNLAALADRHGVFILKTQKGRTLKIAR